MKLESNRIYIRRLMQDDLSALLSVRIRNREFLQPFEPTHLDEHFTLAGQIELFERALHNWSNGLAYGFGIFLKDEDKFIGRVNLSNVVRGAWESCSLGYFLDEAYNGLGLMTEAVRLAVRFAFHEAKLHRVQAAVMPRNLGSIRVLEKAGFLYDGMSTYYLQINGRWEDHNLYSLTVENWDGDELSR
ncbi:GNAT family N-acetyltransferase [Alicyclobacillus curvatus]|nr:GNAT family N-acetyltransferase [Alicyclobacillus curvatus]